MIEQKGNLSIVIGVRRSQEQKNSFVAIEGSLNFQGLTSVLALIGALVFIIVLLLAAMFFLTMPIGFL